MADDKITDESSVKQIETIPEVVESVEDEKQA
jgi:hypothetical protein